MADLRRVHRQPLVACEPVLAEACFLLTHPVQRQRLRRLLAELPVRSIDGGGDTLWDHVFEWLDKYGDHEPDFADGYLLALSSEATEATIWTYDQEFATTWRKLNGRSPKLFVDPRR